MVLKGQLELNLQQRWNILLLIIATYKSFSEKAVSIGLILKKAEIKDSD